MNAHIRTKEQAIQVAAIQATLMKQARQEKVDRLTLAEIHTRQRRNRGHQHP